MPWITTKDGKHINTDWFEQERQIEANKRQADSLNGKSTDLSSMNYADTKQWMRDNSNYSEWEEQMEDVDFTKPESEWWKFDVSETIHNYTGERYSWINEQLRTGTTKRPDWYDADTMKEDIRQLDYAISNFELKNPITVHRSSDSSLLGKDKMTFEQMKAMEGKTISDKGYMSTSTLKELPGEQTVGGDVSYVIDVPSGKGNGAYVARFSENSQEREFLLRRNASYSVSQVTKDKNGNVVVYMKMKKGN